LNSFRVHSSQSERYLFVYKTILSSKSIFLKTNENRAIQMKTRISLVDDERDILVIYKAGLEQNGFLVDGFNDPVQALLSFKAGKYDLALLDIKMPRMNGFELHRHPVTSMLYFKCHLDTRIRSTIVLTNDT
jgi:CheY-like chemotaxis protein